MQTVSEAYLAVAIMTLVGIGFPVGSFILSKLLRPSYNPNDPTKLSSWLLPGYETDQTLYVRRDSTYECGSAPVGDAFINFHFQYYWYAIIFLVFDIAFMFLAFGGIVAIQESGGDIDIWSALATMTIFISLMSLGVWHVFRKRGKIYI
jgi:NADH:ubiquinone oxidoreductase subunit 3 (subunit A)